MINWKFDANQFDPDKTFELIPVGDHRVRVESAEEQISKTGRDMVKLTLAVSGYGSRLFHYIVFMDDRPDITNQNLGMFFDSFGIRPGDMNLQNWIGKVGAVSSDFKQLVASEISACGNVYRDFGYWVDVENNLPLHAS